MREEALSVVLKNAPYSTDGVTQIQITEDRDSVELYNDEC